jgi:hypothetical protein
MDDRDNPWMRYLCVVATFALMACSPTYNWRDIRVENTDLVGMLPCKPDAGSRVVSLGGRDVEMHMSGCDAGGATYAIARADLKEAAAVPAVLAQWRAATLANMAAGPVTESAMRVNAVSRLPPTTMVSAEGKRPDGRAVKLQGIWFAKGAQVFHAVVYIDPKGDSFGKAQGADLTEPFFSGLKFQ